MDVDLAGDNIASKDRASRLMDESMHKGSYEVGAVRVVQLMRVLGAGA